LRREQLKQAKSLPHRKKNVASTLEQIYYIAELHFLMQSIYLHRGGVNMMKNRTRNIKIWAMIFLCYFFVLGMPMYYQLTKSESMIEKAILNISIFVLGLLLPRFLIFFSQPSISISDEVVTLPSKNNPEQRTPHIQIGNYSSNTVYEVRLYIEEFESDGVTFRRTLDNATISRLTQGSNDQPSIFNYELKNFDLSYWRSSGTNLRVTVSFVTTLFNFKGFVGNCVKVC
jgi:hypothetical protein